MKIWHQSFTDLDSFPQYRQTLQEHGRRVMGDEADVVVHGLQPGTYPPGVAPMDFNTRAGLQLLNTRQVCEAALAAQANGYDAFALGCFFDPGLTEARSQVDIPVVSLTETMYQDLRLVTDQIGASLLCPYFVPTGIIHSERNRPTDGAAAKTLTKSQQIGQALLEKAVTGGKITAAEVAQKVFKAISADQFYVFSHESPKALGNITHRMQNIVAMNNPADPFLETPEIGVRLRAQLRAGA